MDPIVTNTPRPGDTLAQIIARTASRDEGATKHDGEKSNRPELIPPEAVTALGTVLAFGAKKYGDRNWEKGFKWSRIFGAAMRHLWAWWGGEKADPETGFSHLYHALACIAFLVAHEARDLGTDDRA